jgi:hypothetical protein
VTSTVRLVPLTLSWTPKTQDAALSASLPLKYSTLINISASRAVQELSKIRQRCLASHVQKIANHAPLTQIQKNSNVKSAMISRWLTLSKGNANRSAGLTLSTTSPRRFALTVNQTNGITQPLRCVWNVHNIVSLAKLIRRARVFNAWPAPVCSLLTTSTEDAADSVI